MVQQSVNLGIPAIQFEFPYTFRNALTYDKNLIKKISDIIGDL